MGGFEVAFSAQAARALEKIVRHIAGDDPAAAGRFGLELVDRALALANPHVRNGGGHLGERPGVRMLVHGSYLILYRFYEGREKVRVLRFWHGARDRRRLFPRL